ncbi:MAG: PEP/pyruvate-binding domain-containing protein [Gammaproteobacteria bacterium]
MKRSVLIFMFALSWATGAGAAEGAGSRAAELRPQIEAMKANPRGPFARIRWFCKDGTLLPPTPSACESYGGGNQHGEWTEAVKKLRTQGYLVANILADLDEQAFVRAPDAADALAQILIEQYLIQVDDGWILRKARYYRGALQEEGERKGARRLLLALVAEPGWLARRYVLLRAAAQALPHGRETPGIRALRQLAADLAARDRRFTDIKNRIHIRPEAQDATRVRAYAASADAALGPDLERLAGMIDANYGARAIADRLIGIGTELESAPPLAARLAQAGAALADAKAPAERMRMAAGLLVELRDRAAEPAAAQARLALLDASIAIENEFFVSAAAQGREPVPQTRRARIELLRVAADAAYGTGLIGARQRTALAQTLASLAVPQVTLAQYKRAADYLALVPGWGTQALRLHFGPALDRYLELDARSAVYLQDHLRGGPLFAYAALVDRVARDAKQLAGVRTELFGESVGSGLRGLNPGLARGTLRVVAQAPTAQEVQADGIYLLPETVSDLPPVAGILTAGEGNPLSHVQLLARNLGIPNVAVDLGLVDKLKAFDGQPVVVAVSPGGAVRIMRDDGSLAQVFESAAAEPDFVIRPDLGKLDLGAREFIDLATLRAADSGRTVGPKAAKLGELKHRYPEAVADGIAIPFGMFRAALEQPMPGEGVGIFDWMVAQYRALAAMPAGSQERRAATEAFRARLERAIAGLTLAPEQQGKLRALLEARFGPDGSYGVFVRSDTNVEDLPGFTGAGLNLTVPNVVGFDRIAASIARVWASPFTARAFAWRQAHMQDPQHVYPAVLLLRTVHSEKSGVLVTRDVDTGADGWLSIAVNEGVGGAVDGQAAESLRVEMATGRVVLLAQATAPRRRVPDPKGGVAELPASGVESVLQPAEIEQLVAFARELPVRFPAVTDEQGRPTAADVEFGFVDGRLRLFQIRPLNESRRARGNAWLASLDPDPALLATTQVVLDAAP